MAILPPISPPPIPSAPNPVNVTLGYSLLNLGLGYDPSGSLPYTSYWTDLQAQGPAHREGKPRPPPPASVWNQLTTETRGMSDIFCGTIQDAHVFAPWPTGLGPNHSMRFLYPRQSRVNPLR